ncbi:potassium/sodium eff [Atractiella rhizophila]|nr:potassium/sodium eff [Atractiella rhizophila]
MTIVLLGAMAVSFGTQDWISGGVIAALVILNVVTGTTQEWKAEKTVARLESVGSPIATVVRHDPSSRRKEGHASQVGIETVVPGDIIILRNGDIVPADARVIEGSVATDEAVLTGESLPVEKDEAPLLKGQDYPIGDRINMVYSGTQVTRGRCRAVVCYTGMNTELGIIAKEMQSKGEGAEKQTVWYKFKKGLGVVEKSPLQIKLNKMAYFLFACAIVIAIIVLASTAFNDIRRSTATYAVAAAVGILPASLVAVVALVLANACNDLAERNALVRRQDAVETLAAVDHVCSDKTGTITLGKMVVKKVWLPAENDKVNLDVGQNYQVESGSDAFYPRGAVAPIRADMSSRPEDDDAAWDEDAVDPFDLGSFLKDFVLCAALNNNATIHHDRKKDSWNVDGDATEAALQVFAHKLGHGKPTLLKPPSQHPSGTRVRRVTTRDSSVPPPRSASPSSDRIHNVIQEGHYELIVEHLFDSTVKRMSNAWRWIPENGASEAPHTIAFLKGAVERVLDSCDFIGLGSKEQLNEELKSKIHEKAEKLAEEGLRVLCLCAKVLPADQSDQIREMSREDFEKDGFCFLGLAGIFDPPRPESAAAIADSKRAGVLPIMLTGDHPSTAKSIAIQIGLVPRNHPRNAVMTGPQFDKLTEEEIDAMPQLPSVVARCSPLTKVRVVDAIHRRNKATIMTGDGVNDAPSLKRADVGVAMGKNGSDVAKQSAEIVLADDNFSTIIRAVRKGRSIFDNLSKFLLYLLSGNVAEVVVLLIGLAFQDEEGRSVFPLSPVAALWINTLSAGPPALCLGLEPTAKDTMSKPPSVYKTIFTIEWYPDLFFYGFVMGALSILNFVLVVWARGKGDLGIDCNEDHNPSCDLAYRARATTYATLCVLLMIHGLVCKHVEMSLFKMDLLDNKPLLFTVVILCISVFPVVYIPTINDKVFLVQGLGWEWGIIFGAIAVYILAAEAWKFGRRRFARYKREDMESPLGLRMAATQEVKILNKEQV